MSSNPYQFSLATIMIVMLVASIIFALCRLPAHVIAGPFFVGLTAAAAYVSQAIGRKRGRLKGACSAVLLALSVVVLFAIYASFMWGPW